MTAGPRCRFRCIGSKEGIERSHHGYQTIRRIGVGQSELSFMFDVWAAGGIASWYRRALRGRRRFNHIRAQQCPVHGRSCRGVRYGDKVPVPGGRRQGHQRIPSEVRLVDVEHGRLGLIPVPGAL